MTFELEQVQHIEKIKTKIEELSWEMDWTSPELITEILFGGSLLSKEEYLMLIKMLEDE